MLFSFNPQKMISLIITKIYSTYSSLLLNNLLFVSFKITQMLENQIK